MRFGSLTAFVLLPVAVQNVSPATSQQARQSHAAKWEAMFLSQVGRCWNKYDSGTNVQTANVAFEIKLRRDGTLEGPPVPEETPATPDRRTYQEGAARALVECQPYQLPAEYYDEWKHFVPVFVPPKFTGS
jgi:colicin import membrane protein